MSVHDWHSHAQQVRPLHAAPAPVVPLPLPRTPQADPLPAAAQAGSHALDQRLAHDLAVLTRVLLGLDGVRDVAPQIAVVEPVQPVAVPVVAPLEITSLATLTATPAEPVIEPVPVAAPKISLISELAHLDL